MNNNYIDVINNIPAIEALRSHTTVILGAGFSRDFNNSKLPLATDFLDVAKKNGIFKPESNHKDLADFVKKYFRDYRTVNIETLATFLTSDVLPEPGIQKEFRTKMYADLKDIIVSTLEHVHQDPSSEVVLEKYKKFCNFLLDIEANIITFNYDLILDQLLSVTGQWSPFDGYGIRMKPYRGKSHIEFLLRQAVAYPTQIFGSSKNDLRRVFVVQPKSTVEYQDRIKNIFGSLFFSFQSKTTLEFFDWLFPQIKHNSIYNAQKSPPS